jgi:hypothetical protein
MSQAERMREALKMIASFGSPGANDEGGQAAARLARNTLDELGLFPRGGHPSVRRAAWR